MRIQGKYLDPPPLSREYTDPYLSDLLRRADVLLLLLDLHGDPLGMLAEWRIFPENAPIPEDLMKLPFIKKVLLVVNKVDGESHDEDYRVFQELSETRLLGLAISVLRKRNLETLLRKIYDHSGIIRAYTRAPGKDVDLTSPFVLPKGSTLGDLAGRIHKDFQKNLKYARM